MPSQQDAPSTADLLQAYGAEIVSLHRPQADLHSGSGIDIHGGVAAILFHRQGLRDRDLFRADYFDTAENDAADTLISARYGIDRIEAAGGEGFAYLERPNAVAGAGTFYDGTRVSVLPTIAGSPVSFEATEDTAVGASVLAIRVPIRNLTAGAQSVGATESTNTLTIDDPVWDTSWRVVSIDCEAGTDRESTEDYKARVKTSRGAQRRGYADAITQVCKDAGASEVALFASDWAGTDHGINHCFVADSGFTTPADLLTSCRLAVETVRVLGADLFVFGMQNVALGLTVTLTVWDVTKTRAALYLADLAKAAIVDFFSARSNAFYWTAESIRGAVFRQIRGELQGVSVTPTVSEPDRTTMLDTALLSRYVVTPDSILVSVVGPS